MGRWLGISWFSSGHRDGEMKKMESEIRAAEGKDKRRMNDPGRKQKVIIAASKGSQEVRIESNVQQAISKWVNIIRQKFCGIAIRRHLASVDYQGARISGLGALFHHPILVKLYDHEMVNIRQLAEELIANGGKGHSVSLVHLLSKRLLTKIGC